jgi:hypothetical protein
MVAGRRPCAVGQLRLLLIRTVNGYTASAHASIRTTAMAARAEAVELPQVGDVFPLSALSRFGVAGARRNSPQARYTVSIAITVALPNCSGLATPVSVHWGSLLFTSLTSDDRGLEPPSTSPRRHRRCRHKPYFARTPPTVELRCSSSCCRNRWTHRHGQHTRLPPRFSARTRFVPSIAHTPRSAVAPPVGVILLSSLGALPAPRASYCRNHFDRKDL